MPQTDESDNISLGKEELKIGLALSGGGVRATAFHFGVLGRLAIENMLEQIRFISTVSGGSLGTGLVYSAAGNKWPTSKEYLEQVAPKAKHLLTHTDIQRDLILGTLTQPWLLFKGRAKLVSESVQRRWGISGLVKDIPTKPRWIINATAYELGKDWRFMPQRMGDYKLNYVQDPPIPIADAIAASAGYPAGIGYFELDTAAYSWSMYAKSLRDELIPASPVVKKIHLYDGGIYDNLGVEFLFKPQNENEYREGMNFLIVSDASAGMGIEQSMSPIKRVMRLVGLASDQTRSLRSRMIIRKLRAESHKGAYIQIGNRMEYILKEAGLDSEVIVERRNSHLPDTDVDAAAATATTLRRLTASEYDRLYRHGWEVADSTLSSYCGDYFSHIAFPGGRLE